MKVRELALVALCLLPVQTFAQFRLGASYGSKDVAVYQCHPLSLPPCHPE